MEASRQPRSVQQLVDSLGRALEAEPEVVLARLFGSQATGNAHPGSDTDLAVLFAQGRAVDAERVRQLEGRLQRELRGRELHLVDLGSAPPLLAYEIMTRGRTVLARRDGIEEDIRLRAIKRHWDNKLLYEARRSMLRRYAGLGE
jgi:predicted nucleotidyltransferase